eukprot:Gb_26072 [translate_table: standard]
MLATFFSSIPYISRQIPPFFKTLSLNLWVFASALTTAEYTTTL